MNIFENIQNLTLAVVAVISSTVASVTPIASPQPQKAEERPPKDIITRSGEYTYSGYTQKYTIKVPKNGGPVSGKLEGVCQGTINGNYQGPKTGVVSGQAQAKCGVAFIRYKLTASYSGKLDLKVGKADINWEGQIPYTENKGSFTLYFESAN